MKWCRASGRTIAERFHRDARQVKGNVADGNELTAFLRLAFLVHRVPRPAGPALAAIVSEHCQLGAAASIFSGRLVQHMLSVFSAVIRRPDPNTL